MSLIHQAPSAPSGSGEAEELKEEAITFSPMAEEVSDFVFVHLCIFAFACVCTFEFWYFVHFDSRGGKLGSSFFL